MAARPRMVMLVDGGVVGDSRVQKSALAAAEAGWDVTLVGRAPTGVADEFMLGPVRVLRLAAPYTLLAHERRSPARGRYPLAYRAADELAMRKRLLDVRWTDYQAQVQLAKRAGRSGGLTTRGGLVGRRAAWTASSYWHRLRSLQYRRAVAFAKEPHGPVEAASVAVQRALLGARAWRRMDPVLWDLEVAFGPVIDELAPDIIHAHDFRMSGVAARAVARAHAKGRRVPWIYDVHEYVAGVHSRSGRWRAANTAYEREYIRLADAVVTVSPKLAQMLQRDYHLAETPTVVLNAPSRAPRLDGREVPDLRSRCGVAAGVPLLVYSGSGSPTRGLRTMVEALPVLPEVHVALVMGSRSGHVLELEQLAAKLGVRDRLHIVRYVPPELVPAFLASATAGVIPILHFPNHEIALITKYFEYLHAGLPIVVSDVETMARTTRELGNGVVFTAGDVDDYVRAVRALLESRERFAGVYRDRPELVADYSWERQAEVLRGLWSRLSGRTPEPVSAVASPAAAAGPPLLELRADADAEPEARKLAEGLAALDPDARVVLDRDDAATHLVLVGARWLADDRGPLAQELLDIEQAGVRARLVVDADAAAALEPAELARRLTWLGVHTIEPTAEALHAFLAGERRGE